VSTAMFGWVYLYLKHVNEQLERSEREGMDDKGLRDPIGFRYLL